MIGIVVMTHGSLASGFESAVRLLAGNPERFATVELQPGDDPLEFKGRVDAALASVDDEDGILALVDLFGGTPSNTISQFMGRSDVRAIAGASLPMIIEAVFSRDQMTIDELSRQVLQAGREALIDIRQRFVEAAQSDDEEDF